MELEEMTPKQQAHAKRLGEKIRRMENVSRELTNLRRDNNEMYSELKIHRQYLAVLTNVIDKHHGDKCVGEGEDPLWHLRKEAEAELYEFMSKPASFDDIEDTWNEKSEGETSPQKEG